MKLKYRNITVPYRIYNTKGNYFYYIYQNKKYTDHNKLFTDFLGSYLTYHYEIKDKLCIVHNLNEVLESLLNNPKDFNIPKNYKEEYSQDEYKYIIKLKDKLLNNDLKKLENNNKTLELKDFKNKKQYNFAKEIYEKYKNIKFPKKVHSDEFNKDYYVLAGEYYETIYAALREIYEDDLYYQFGGTKTQNNRSHFHSHNFEDLISMIFDYSNKFKIHVSQREFYSEQELEFLKVLSIKLKKMNFHSVERTHNSLDYEEYFYLKDNKEYIRLLIHNIRYTISERKYQKEKLKSHKI